LIYAGVSCSGILIDEKAYIFGMIGKDPKSCIKIPILLNINNEPILTLSFGLFVIYALTKQNKLYQITEQISQSKKLELKIKLIFN
jgi:hypothetical protein